MSKQETLAPEKPAHPAMGPTDEGSGPRAPADGEGRAERLLAPIAAFFSTWRFPVLALALLLGSGGLLLGMLLVPPDSTPLARFAESFREFCFGRVGPEGGPGWISVAVTLSQPVLLALLIVWVWQEPLAELARQGARAALPWAGAGLSLSAGTIIALPFLVPAPLPPDPTIFPADSLRTALEPPEIDLTAHDGARVRLAELRGKVVLLTSVYATCGATCPMILAEVRRVTERLTPAQREEVRILAITMDPERDTLETLAGLAKGQQVAAPLVRLLTGDPARVHPALDALGIARRTDPETGRIDHANLFILVDREGRIAYRFTLGEDQERWLLQALTRLVDER